MSLFIRNSDDPQSSPTSAPFRSRRNKIAASSVAFGLVIGVSVLTPLAAVAAASPAACTPTANPLILSCVVTFTAPGAEQTFVVPADVTTVTVTASGANGGSGLRAAVGGGGGLVTKTVSVSPGSTYYVEVGGAGGLGSPFFDGEGGTNGGGVGYLGGGGGGASDVRTISKALNSRSLNSRILIAAGGGGGGYNAISPASTGGGGFADQDGGKGAVYLNGGGKAGSATAGGAGGYSTQAAASAGTLGQGGNGGRAGGGNGGGGGGLFGGGGGGDTGGGGGGGSSVGTVLTTNSAGAWVTFTYNKQAAPTPVAPMFTSDSPPASVVAGTPFSYPFVATGVPAAMNYSASGSLPNGVTLSTAGLLSGTPIAAGRYTFTVTAGNTTLPNTPGAQHTLTVTAAALAKITVIPATKSVVSGDAVAFEATGTDNNSNIVALDAPVFSIEGGSCDGSTCRTTAYGDVTVTVTSGSITGQMTLAISPTPLQIAAQLGAGSDFSVLAGAAVTVGAGSTAIIDTGAAYVVGAGAAVTLGAGAIVLGTSGTGVESDNSAAAAHAITDIATSYANLKALVPAVELSGADLSTHVLTSGVYHSTAAINITDQVTFDAGNDPNAIFVIQSDAAINTAAATSIVLKNGAKASNIFWVTTGAATLGASSTFYGNIVSNAAVTVGANTDVFGRTLSVTAAVTLGANSVINTRDIHAPGWWYTQG